MKARLINSQYNNNLLKHKRQALTQQNFKDSSIKRGENITTDRPAQAISFSGSAFSAVHKLGNTLLESSALNSLIKFTNNKEAAFSAIFALFFAGMLKPMLILFQTGHDDKDGQMIATKNFLSAFTGFLLKYTIEGSFINKIVTTMIDNVNLIKEEKAEDGSYIIVAQQPDSKDVQKVAKKYLIKENSRLIDRYRYAADKADNQSGASKVKEFFKSWKKFEYIPEQKDIDAKAETIVSNLKTHHLSLFNKNDRVKDFILSLNENFKFTENAPYDAKTSIAQGLKSQPSDAFKSLWKNFLGSATAIGKAKITSILLPATIAAIFAKRNAEAEAIKRKEQQKNATNISAAKCLEKNSNFKVILEGNKNKESSKNEQVTFKGSFIDMAVQKSAWALEQLAFSKLGQDCANGVAKISKIPAAIMSHIESWLLTAYWVVNTQRSKKIHPDQKLGFNIHTVLVTVVSSIAAFVIDNIFNHLVTKAEGAYVGRLVEAKNLIQKENPNIKPEQLAKQIGEKCAKLYNSKDIAEELAKNGVFSDEKNFMNHAQNLAAKYSKDLNKFKSLLIFAMVVRFLVPVLTVKLSKKLKKYLVEQSKKISANKAEKEAMKAKTKAQAA